MLYWIKLMQLSEFIIPTFSVASVMFGIVSLASA